MTIFGESAGSGSVAVHLVSPLSQSLFSAAVSASALEFQAFVRVTRPPPPSPAGDGERTIRQVDQPQHQRSLLRV